MNSIRTENDFGEVIHSNILKLLGSELNYNELKFYTENKNATSYLEVVENKFTEEQFILIQVRINSVIVLDTRFELNGGYNEFLYLLNEMREEYNHEEEDEEEEETIVEKFKFQGIIYLKDDNNMLYDLNCFNMIGIWNEETKMIDELPDEEEEIERQKLLIEFWRLEKMSPKAMFVLFHKKAIYHKYIEVYTTEEIREIILDILNYNIDNYVEEEE